MKIEKRHFFLLTLGAMWSLWLKVVPSLTIYLGVTVYGSSAFMVYLTGSIGDFINVSLASLLLGLTVSLAGLRDYRWWEIYIAVAPGLVWAMYDLHTRFLPLGGETIMTLCYFATLLVMPPVMTRLARWMSQVSITAMHADRSDKTGVERRLFFLFFLGVLWSPWLIQLAVWIGQIDVFEHGDTLYAIRSTAIVDDMINVGLASLALGLLIVLSGMRPAYWWEMGIVVLPSLAWTAVDFSRLFLSAGHIGITEVVYVLALFSVPLLMTQLIGRLVNGSKTVVAS